MKTKISIAIFIIAIMSISNVCATAELINESLYIYDESNTQYRMHVWGDDLDRGANVDRVRCEDCICVAMNIWIASNEDFEYDYELNYAPTETEYFTSIITINHTTYDSLLFGMYRKIYETLEIDGVEVANRNRTGILNVGASTHIAFNTLDRTCTLGSTKVNNVTLFFDDMICTEQYNDVYNGSDVQMKFETVGDEGHTKNKLGGFTGIFLSVLQKMPFIGESLYNVLYPPMTIIQYSLNFVFTFLNLIIYDWWYAVLLLECICMIKALSCNGYDNVMHVYVNTHIIIGMFVYSKLIIPTINMIISILNTIKNMIQWW
ncbi:hypothetical protein KAX97_05320 [candidate division WOR-3 bacterium]|nr:hypothetical protein [candidate division WOR-3 bacterium]